MSEYTINGNTLSGIADAIRSKTGSAASMTPTQMPSQIEEIGMINYSTDEQVIGTWIDGKPLYQKVIPVSGTFAGSAQDVITLTGLAIDTVVSLSGTTKRSSDNSLVQTLTFSSATDSYGACYYMKKLDSGYYKICSTAGSNNTLKDPVFILQYTKTTD